MKNLMEKFLKEKGKKCVQNYPEFSDSISDWEYYKPQNIWFSNDYLYIVRVNDKGAILLFGNRMFLDYFQWGE